MKVSDPDRQLLRLGRVLHIIIGALVALATWGLAQTFAFRPQELNQAALEMRATELEHLLLEGTKVRAEHARLRDQVAAADQKADALYRRIPAEPREAEFLAQVSDLAQQVGLRIQDYRPGEILERKSSSELRVGLTSSGEYSQVCRFLEGLTALPRYSNLAALEIEAGAEDQPLKVVMTLIIYFNAQRQDAERTPGND